MKPFDGTYTSGWMRRFAESVLTTEEELTVLDQRAGDGDFGGNLSAGLRVVLDRLDTLPAEPMDTGVPLLAAAEVFLDEVGGTSGPLFGLLLEEIADATQRERVLTVPALATGTSAGLEAIQRVGEAEPGDKTMIDALVPAVRALEETDEVEPLDRAMDAASHAAWEGVRETARLSARRGRASYLGGRASGVADPGAVGIALLFSSANETVTQLPPLEVVE